MLLALLMVCSTAAQDDCKIYKDLRGLHLTEESCLVRIEQMMTDLQEAHERFIDETQYFPATTQNFTTNVMVRLALRFKENLNF